MKRISKMGLMIAVVLACACSDDPGADPVGVIGDTGFNLFNYVHVADIEPSHFVQGASLQFNLVYNCRFEGKGNVYMHGRGGGQPIGEMVSPSSGELGSMSFEVLINSGENAIPISLIPTTENSSLGFEISVSCDSLLLEGGMVYWRAPEVLEEGLYPSTAFYSNSQGEIVTLERAAN